MYIEGKKLHLFQVFSSLFIFLAPHPQIPILSPSTLLFSGSEPNIIRFHTHIIIQGSCLYFISSPDNIT